MKFSLTLQYKGSAYHGWQKQLNALSVQQVIETAIFKVWDFQVELVGCGRTDTGVHAAKYVAHFEMDEAIDPEFVYKLNAVLPPDIAIRLVEPTRDDFHARFSAKSREYRYFIHQKKNPFLWGQSWFFSKHLNHDLMNEACKILKQHHDFASFCKKWSDNKTTLCHIEEAVWEKTDEGFVFKIVADRFLRNMVRAIVGCMIDVGIERLSPKDFHQIILNKDRNFTGTSVDACGLFLWDIKY